MKLLILASLLFSTASFANTFRCEQIKSKDNSKYSIKIEELKDITKEVSYGTAYDAVLKVKVDISKTVANKKTIVKSFEAVATTYDVVYTVNAVKAQGVKIGLYMDSDDDNYMVLTDSNGTKTSTYYRCQ